MRRRLKNFFRGSHSHKNVPPSSPSQADRRSDGLATVSQVPSNLPSNVAMQVPLQASKTIPGNEPSCEEDNRQQSQSISLHPDSVDERSYVSAIDFNQPVQEPNDSLIASDQEGRHPAVSLGDNSRDSHTSHYMSLGGDSRLMTGASEMRHSEDVADRNIDMYGAHSQDSSLLSQGGTKAANAQHDSNDRTLAGRRQSLSNGSAESAKTPVSFNSASSAAKYTLGTGIATEGSLIDGILPHGEDSKTHRYNKKNRPFQIARDERHVNQQKRKPKRGSVDRITQRRRGSEGGSLDSYPEEERTSASNAMTDLRTAVMDGQQDYKSVVEPLLDGVVDLNDTEDVDKSTQWAPAVTHEDIRPTEHTIHEEKIYREIHNHDVYHRIQPVYETEILPARHFIRNPDGALVEVSEDQLPDCNSQDQKWVLMQKEGSTSRPAPHYPEIREPRVVADKTYVTPEGFERRETTTVHPPQLEDMSDYKGPVFPVHFTDKDDNLEDFERKSKSKRLNHLPDSRQFTLKELTDSLPVLETPSRDISPVPGISPSLRKPHVPE